MSDCSMNAMKPKEPPKTCGNCGKCIAIVGHCDDSNDRVDLYDQSYENWTPRTDDPEQRCQQLEQVAREMFVILDKNLSPSFTWEFCEQLEALGVSMDD